MDQQVESVEKRVKTEVLEMERITLQEIVARAPDWVSGILKEIVEKRIEEYRVRIARIDAELRQLKDTNHSIAPGSMRGMGLTDSIHSYLVYVGHNRPVPLVRVIEALQVGGVELGNPDKPKRYLANVKTTIVNNSRRFRYNKRNDTVELQPRKEAKKIKEREQALQA
jgi:hypothetical protein